MYNFKIKCGYQSYSENMLMYLYMILLGCACVIEVKQYVCTSAYLSSRANVLSITIPTSASLHTLSGH